MDRRQMTDKWIMKDGTQINVKNMETSHIKNSLAMLKRKGFIAQSTFESYFCCYPRGDMAQMAFDQEFDEVMKSPVSQFIDIFENELEARGESQ